MIANYERFRRVNVDAVNDESVFVNFKRLPEYTYMLEHVNQMQAEQYIDVVLRENPDLLNPDLISKFVENDSIGNPIRFCSMFGEISPTIFRYVKVLSDLKKHFESLDGLNIIELGAGNGGQCNIISKLFEYNTYTIVDIPDVMELQKKCLTVLGNTNVNFKKMEELEDDVQYDLVISNYAFSEIAMELRDFYISKVLSKANRGYLTMNDAHATNLEERLLPKQIEIFDEVPKTGPDNYIVVWR